MIFINPDCFQGYRYPSIGMLYLAAALERAGRQPVYIDQNYDADWAESLSAAARDHEWVGITANILSIRPALRVAEHVRARHPGLKIAMGGPYPTVRYERLLPVYADAVFVGESEETIVDFFTGADLADIKGIAWHDGEKVVFNGRRPLIENIDDIPMPAWHLGDTGKYWLTHAKRNPVLPVITSRGCPFDCVFCSSDLTFGNRIRYRSLDRVLEEMDELIYTHGAREIQFWDDNITLKKERAEELFDRIADRKYRGVSMMIPSGIKPDTGDYRLFSKMRRAGMYSVCIAVESGDPEIMEKLGKKVDVTRVPDVIRSARRAGLIMNGFFMLGLPFDTEETMKRNIEYACSLPLHQAMFFITIPFPGTWLYDFVKENGRLLYEDEMDLCDSGYFLGKASYELPHLGADSVEQMFRLANRRFYMRPVVLLTLVLRKSYSPRHLMNFAIKWFKVLFRGRQF